MKRNAFFLAGVALFVLTGVCYAQSDTAFVGTWKLNQAKSKVSSGTPTGSTVTYAPSGDMMKVTVDGMDASGNPEHWEWTGKFDGKDYAVTGDPASDTRSYRRINAHTLESTSKKGDKVTGTARIVVAADGKTRTVTITVVDAQGTKHTSTEEFDKQ